MDALRPEFSSDLSGDSFDGWYWSKEELTDICRSLGLSRSGSRLALRTRIRRELDGLPPEDPKTAKPKSRFAWSKAELTRDTVITDNISFGPHVRRWFTAEIGPKFVCHGDFMNWVKQNIGRSLGDAVEAWHVLEARKDNPEFRREIADHNTYLQYLRDFKDANPDILSDAAKRCWQARKCRPAPGGRITYHPDDLRFV